MEASLELREELVHRSQNAPAVCPIDLDALDGRRLVRHPVAGNAEARETPGQPVPEWGEKVPENTFPRNTCFFRNDGIQPLGGLMHIVYIKFMPYLRHISIVTTFNTTLM
jgi:hypothetical protein